MSATPTTLRPMRADAQRHRARILAAARDAFATDGFDDTHVEGVARAAGVGVATVYRHFPTKEALALALAAERFEILAAEARRQLVEQPDPWIALRDFLWFSAEVQVADRALGDALAAQPAAVYAIACGGCGLRDAAQALVDRAHEAGAIGDFGADDIPMLMCGLGRILQMAGGDGPPVRWRRYMELLLDGLRAGGARRAGRRVSAKR